MSGYFVRLEAELVEAAARERPKRRGRGRRVALLAAAALVLAGVPAAAVRDRGRVAGQAEQRLLRSDPIATGATANGARWELLASDGERGFCFGIAMPSGDPRELAPGAGVTCGEHEPGELTIHVSSSGAGLHTRGRPRHSLASGTAPDAAVGVTIAHGGRSLHARTFDDRRGIEGRFYVAGIPLSWQRGRRHVEAIDANGRVIARAGG
jgi:hypothetical protein